MSGLPGFIDGREWMQLPNLCKSTFVAGAIEVDELWQVTDKGEKREVHAQFHAGNMSVGDVVEAVDHFYEDAANRDISAVFALQYVAYKAGGATPPQLVEYLRDLRRSAAHQEELRRKPKPLQP